MSLILPLLDDMRSLIESRRVSGGCDGNRVVFEDMKLRICKYLKKCNLGILNFWTACSNEANRPFMNMSLNGQTPLLGQALNKASVKEG